MRGKRSKQYRKLMQQYGLSFGFREPYQVLVDAEIIRDADRFKMDLIGGLERTLHGQVKPMITQCSMRHLYLASSEPGVSFLIDKAKTYERRRCNHLPEDYPVPLSAEACLSSVVDPKDSKTNKHRYVVASQDLQVRKAMREIMGVPLVYINRSVMIMEPMADESRSLREKDERGKFREGIKGRERGSGSAGIGLKRKRDETEGEKGGDTVNKVRRKGPKGPNPLSVKKPMKRPVEGEGAGLPSGKKEQKLLEGGTATRSQRDANGMDPSLKRKRKRKHKSAAGVEGAAVAEMNGDSDDRVD